MLNKKIGVIVRDLSFKANENKCEMALRSLEKIEETKLSEHSDGRISRVRKS